MGGARIEICFPRQEQVSVFLENAEPTAVSGRAASGALFALFAARTLVNLGPSAGGQGLARSLRAVSANGYNGFTTHQLLSDNDVSVIPAGPGKGRKGFVSSYDSSKARFFSYKPYGFGILGRGADFYGPMAVFAFLGHLFEETGASQSALEDVAHLVGNAAVQGSINVANQHEVALSAARVAGVLSM